MISFCCAVTRKNLKDYTKVLTDTLCRHTTLVREVILVQTDTKDGLVESWDCGKIRFSHYGCQPLPCPKAPAWEQMICGHARGLHKAIEYVQQEYVWLSDPDVFLLSAVDQTYLRLIQRYDLNLIGVSHFNPLSQAYQFCPCIINCMMRRDTLPTSDWLGGFHAQSEMRLGAQPVFPVGHRWMIPGPLAEHKFPKSDGLYDTGCNIWLWNEEKKGRWISFQLDQINGEPKNTGFRELVYPMNYKLKNYKSNFGLADDLGNDDLLYHRTRGSREKSASYRRLYESLYQPLP